VEVRFFQCTVFGYVNFYTWFTLTVETAQQNSGQAATEFWLPVRFQHHSNHTASVTNILLCNIERNALSLQYDTHGDCRNFFAVLYLFILCFNFLSLRMYYQEGRAIVKAVCPWLLTAKTRCHFLVSRWGIYGRQSGNDAEFSPSISVFPSLSFQERSVFIQSSVSYAVAYSSAIESTVKLGLLSTEAISSTLSFFCRRY